MCKGRFSLSDRNQSRSDLPGSANRVAGHIDRAGVENQSAFRILRGNVQCLRSLQLFALFRKNREHGLDIDSIFQNSNVARSICGSGQQRNREQIDSPVLCIDMGDRRAAVTDLFTVQIRILDGFNTDAADKQRSGSSRTQRTALPETVTVRQ